MIQNISVWRNKFLCDRERAKQSARPLCRISRGFKLTVVPSQSHRVGQRPWDDVSADMRAEASLQQQRDSTLMQVSSDAAAVEAYAAATKGGKQAATQRAGRPLSSVEAVQHQ